ncbi:MAG: DUF58 domain-containing protein [Acidobacteria bacterium]|nr:DUF58 domain-containing protein [Acidobacteriota bacterium]
MFWRRDKKREGGLSLSSSATAGPGATVASGAAGGGRGSLGGQARFLDPEVLGRIASLELLARTVVEGFIAGLHRSPYTGFSTEFAEYRQYMPGDDLRYLDWKLLGRTDRYYIRKYRADTNAQLHLLVDASGSMGYSSGAVTKLSYARFVGAAIAYLANRQQDAVGLMAFDSEIRTHIPALNRTGHMRTVFGNLERLNAGRETGLSAMIHQVAERITRRGLVVLISDLYDEPAALIESLQHLRFRGNDVLVFHLLDRRELEFDYTDATLLEDLETGEQIHVLPELLADGYREAISRHIAELRTGLARNRIDYEVLTTDQPLDHSLHTFLARRSRQ